MKNDPRLRIGMVSGILHPKYGGPSTVVRMFVDALGNFADLSLFGVGEPVDFKVIYEQFPDAGIFPLSFPKRWFRGKGLEKALSGAVSRLDLIHAHMLWDQPVYAAWRVSRNAAKPLIVTPHGSLSASWRHRTLHKRIYRELVLDRILRDTTFLHVLTPAEESACREYGVSCPIRVIPNGLPEGAYDMPRTPDLALERWPQLRSRRVMLYLGRLWEGKGLNMMVETWAKITRGTRNKDWILVLSGPDYRNYRTKLVRRVEASGIADNTLLTGPVDRVSKDSLLAIAECFVLPSYGEGFSLSLLEAVAAGVPVVYSRECNFPEVAANGGGWEIEAREEYLTDILQMVLGKETESLQDIGQKGRAFCRKRYTLERVATEMMSMYGEALEMTNRNPFYKS